eukprot:1813085-Rhodomonas_salina.1
MRREGSTVDISQTMIELSRDDDASRVGSGAENAAQSTASLCPVKVCSGRSEKTAAGGAPAVE